MGKCKEGGGEEMSRQEEVKKIARRLKKITTLHEMGSMRRTQISKYLVDNGIRSKNGFEIAKTRDTDFNRRTGGIQYGWFVTPIEYKEKK